MNESGTQESQMHICETEQKPYYAPRLQEYGAIQDLTYGDYNDKTDDLGGTTGQYA